jgi:hypothetical protein
LTFEYFAFGLNITSEIECPELLAGRGGPPDLTIRYGLTPRELEGTLARGKTYQITSDRLLLDIEGTARYLIQSGREIIIEPYSKSLANLVRLLLLGSAFGALLLQRGFWPLHGSAVATGHGAAVFVGPSGYGKSTLAGAFHQRGFVVLADDVCAISLNPDGQAQLWPAYPRLRLQDDALVHLGKDRHSLQKTHAADDKFEILLGNIRQDPVVVDAIYSLVIKQQEGIILTPLKGFEIIRELTINTYRLHRHS